MPKLSPQLKKIRNMEFLEALKETGSAKKAAKLVGNLGSQGGKDIENVASVMGTKRLKQVNLTLLDALLARGVNPKKIAKKIDTLLDAKVRIKTFIKGGLETEIEHEDSMAIDKGLNHAIKIGVGGGYAPEKHLNLNLEIKKEDRKLAEKALKEIKLNEMDAKS